MTKVRDLVDLLCINSIDSPFAAGPLIGKAGKMAEHQTTNQMKNLFDPGVADEVKNRIHQLSNRSTPLWGKMNVSQMMAHCVKPMQVALGEISLKKAGFLKRIMGRMIKAVVVSPKPYKPNLPTDPGFVTVTDAVEFETARQELLATFERYMQNQDRVADIPHPFFGKLTKHECGLSQFKHLDHHLRQFGV